MDNTGKGLLAFLAGVSLGVIAGLLIAPESGADTQGRISRKAREFGDDLGHQADQGRQKINDVADRISKKASGMMS
ncbi:YtxH domain-containing protein [Persicobacter psychrovividus]|uniref:YtxH domain-containing protein n=1 Tax=Persicobacter psychrovividus TaxID=387638 RepID=A0ABM7VBK8_9BACT|nr:hypothetical protein PEPS_05930 [Persicobacter psychrovividus]